MGTTSPEIILYTNHLCPWAHRAHIALAELQLPFKEEIIDLSTPRTAEYLKINPRGLVPNIKYNGEIVTESAIVAQFLADAHPSHLVKPSEVEGGALQRARIIYLVDAYFSKPLLKDVNPFFGGSSKLTLAEVLTGSFLLRVLTFPKYEELNLMPKSFLTDIETKAPAFWKWSNAVIKEKSVNHIYDEKSVVERTAEQVKKMVAASK